MGDFGGGHDACRDSGLNCGAESCTAAVQEAKDLEDPGLEELEHQARIKYGVWQHARGLGGGWEMAVEHLFELAGIAFAEGNDEWATVVRTIVRDMRDHAKVEEMRQDRVRRENASMDAGRRYVDAKAYAEKLDPLAGLLAELVQEAEAAEARLEHGWMDTSGGAIDEAVDRAVARVKRRIVQRLEAITLSGK